jgi:carboxylesterase type B
MNATRKRARGFQSRLAKDNEKLQAVVNAWSIVGGHAEDDISYYSDDDDNMYDKGDSINIQSQADQQGYTYTPGSYSWDRKNWLQQLQQKAQSAEGNTTKAGWFNIFGKTNDRSNTNSNNKAEELTPEEKAALKAEQRLLRKKERAKAKALKEAAKVVVDYRPVMARIIDDYLFRCPGWHLAQLLSENRLKAKATENVFVYRFSQPTHIPGYKECWGKVRRRRNGYCCI